MQEVYYVLTYVLVFIIGACIGSFLCCQARRLRLKEKGKPSLGRRSVCLNCKHRLKWYENLPIISWLLQRGKCRKCGKKIGVAEFLSELLTGLTVLGIVHSFFYSHSNSLNYDISAWLLIAVVLLLILSLIFLAIYDGLYGELPCLCLTFSGICAIIIVIIHLSSEFCGNLANFSWQPILDHLFAVLILGGIYLVLYLVSRGKWVGDGDWILGTIIALALGSPWLALIVLFIANFSACLVMYPKVRKLKNHTIYFGQFLVFAFILTLILSSYGIINL